MRRIMGNGMIGVPSAVEFTGALQPGLEEFETLHNAMIQELLFCRSLIERPNSVRLSGRVHGGGGEQDLPAVAGKVRETLGQTVGVA